MFVSMYRHKRASARQAPVCTYVETVYVCRFCVLLCMYVCMYVCMCVEATHDRRNNRKCVVVSELCVTAYLQYGRFSRIWPAL